MPPIHDNAKPADFGLWTLDFRLLASASLLLAMSAPLLAQPTSAPPRDPLMSLMTSQPQIYISPAPQATASFDPPVVRPGEQAFYRVVFDALEDCIEWPGKVAVPAQLEIRPGAHGQILQMVSARLEPRTSFNHRVRAANAGMFVVISSVVEVY